MGSEPDSPRPLLECGQHIRQCLTSAPQTVLEELLAFSHNVAVTEQGSILGEVMAALAFDVMAAQHVVDDQLDEILDG